MSKFKVGDLVVPHKFESDPLCVYWDDQMRCFIEAPGRVKSIDIVGNYEVHGWSWPESALTPYTPEPTPPRYDLKEFTLAAMTSILKSESAWHDVAGIDEFGKMAVKIARATIKALQEAEKEGIL